MLSRASKVVEYVRLLNSGLYTTRYYNPERQALEHFRFPQFLRQTKECYISFITPEMLELVKESVNLPTLTYDKIRLACWKQGITCGLRFARKIFASHLRHSGIEPEVVNLLQGRVDSDILTRHYLVPQNSLKDQVIDALKQLQKMID